MLMLKFYPIFKLNITFDLIKNFFKYFEICDIITITRIK
jgi:hypothetical protein